jgi:hypothetical protein
MTVFWDRLCSLVEVYQAFRCAYCLHHQVLMIPDLLQRDYRALYPRKLSSSNSHRENMSTQDNIPSRPIIDGKCLSEYQLLKKGLCSIELNIYLIRKISSTKEYSGPS